MYQNALIVGDQSITLSSNSNMLRARSLGYSPRYSPFNTSSTGICLNAVYPKWMYSPPVIKHRKQKPKRDFIAENKILAANPSFIAQLPPTACEAVDMKEFADTARAAYNNFIRTMRSRDDRSQRKIRCRWSGYSPGDVEADFAEQQLLEFANRVPGDDQLVVEKSTSQGNTDIDAAADADAEVGIQTDDTASLENQDNRENQKTFIDELLEDTAFVEEIAHAKDRIDCKLNPMQANPNLAPSPFEQSSSIGPTFRYEKGTTGEVLVLVRPENLQAPVNDSKFLYTNEELEKIAATSIYGNYLLRRQEDLYRAPYLIPYTFRSSRI